MIQKFTTPCFIRKNTAELRKKLEELGYKILPNFVPFPCLSTKTDGIAIPTDEFNRDGGIDCDTNEDLFLVLAALREDSDYMQLFTNGKNFILCDKVSWLDKMSDLSYKHGLSIFAIQSLYDYHKATVEEIIEHFKD